MWSSRERESRGAAQHLVSPKVWEAVEHSMSLERILFFPQFEEQNRDQGGNLHTDTDAQETKEANKSGGRYEKKNTLPVVRETEGRAENEAVP